MSYNVTKCTFLAILVWGGGGAEHAMSKVD